MGISTMEVPLSTSNNWVPNDLWNGRILGGTIHFSNTGRPSGRICRSGRRYCWMGSVLDNWARTLACRASQCSENVGNSAICHPYSDNCRVSSGCHGDFLVNSWKHIDIRASLSKANAPSPRVHPTGFVSFRGSMRLRAADASPLGGSIGLPPIRSHIPLLSLLYYAYAVAFAPSQDLGQVPWRRPCHCKRRSGG